MSTVSTITAPLIGDDPSGLKELGRQLEEARRSVGISQAEFGRRFLGFSQSTTSRILDGTYQHMSPQQRRTAEMVVALAHGGAMASAPYVSLEQGAASLGDSAPLVIPGLLQTVAYARCALHAADPGLRPAELDQAVALRMSRQKIWNRTDPVPPLLTAIVGEAALCRRVGSPAIMREQMGRLIEMDQHPSVSVRVLPFDTDDSVGLLGPFVLASFASGEQPDAAFLDDALNGSTTTDHGIVAKLRDLFQGQIREAENRAGSIRMIREAEARWT